MNETVGVGMVKSQRPEHHSTFKFSPTWSSRLFLNILSVLHWLYVSFCVIDLEQSAGEGSVSP